MRKLLLPIGISALLLLPFVGSSQSSTLWKFVGSLQPNVSSWLVESPGGLSGSTLTVSGLKNCSGIQTNGNGVTSCGSGGGGFGTGNVITITNGRYVNQAGDTMTGSLNILNGKNLQVAGTITGSIIKAATSLASSGTLVWETTASGAALWVSTFEGAGLTDCDAATSTLTWDATSKRYGCGTDSDTTYTAGEGLTLTSTSFSLSDTISGTLLEFTTVSGATVHAQDQLRSSGSLVVEGTTTLNGAVTIISGNLSNDSIIEPDLNVDNSPNDGDIFTYDSTGTNFAWITPNAGTDITADLEEETHATEHNEGGADALTVESLASSCTDAQVVGGNGSGGAECQADIDTNTTYTAAQGLTLSSTAFSLTPFHSGTTLWALTALRSSGSLSVDGTTSGHILRASTLLTTSGSLAVEGAFFQDSFADCDAATNKVLYDLTTGKYSCSTDDDVPESGDFGAAGDLDNDGTITDGVIDKADLSTSTDFGDVSTDGSSNIGIDADVIGQSEVSDDALDFAELQNTLDVDENTVVVLGSSTLEIAGYLSGSVLHADDTLSSSGTLTWEGAGSGASLYVGDDFFGAGLSDCDDGTNSKLLWDETTKRFSCGADQGGGGGISQSAADARYVNQSGDTMTGKLTINLTTGSDALEVIQTMSGNIIHAQTELHSSGSLIVEGTMLSRADVDIGNGLSITSGAVDVYGGNLVVSGGTFRNSGGETILHGGNVVIGANVTPETELEVIGTMSGRLLTLNAGNTANNYILGELGIGMKVPKTRLEVNGTVSGALIQSSRHLIGSGTLILESGAILDAGVLYVAAGNNRIGINTTTPTSAITVRAGSDQVFQTSSSTNNHWIMENGSLDDQWTLGMISDGATWFIYDNDAGQRRFEISDQGNVGIGENSATSNKAKLNTFGTMSGYQLTVSANATGSGKMVIQGSDGAKICLRDTDGAGYTVLTGNNGTISGRVATGTECNM